METVGDDLPELATNDEWRGIMRRARATRQLTQAELGRLVGTSQNMISNIESGNVSSSQFVRPICEALGITPPMFYENEEDRAWVQLGRVLRARNLELFRRALAMVEGIANTVIEAQDGNPTEQ